MATLFDPVAVVVTPDLSASPTDSAVVPSASVSSAPGLLRAPHSAAPTSRQASPQTSPQSLRHALLRPTEPPSATSATLPPLPPARVPQTVVAGAAPSPASAEAKPGTKRFAPPPLLLEPSSRPTSGSSTGGESDTAPTASPRWGAPASSAPTNAMVAVVARSLNAQRLPAPSEVSSLRSGVLAVPASALDSSGAHLTRPLQETTSRPARGWESPQSLLNPWQTGDHTIATSSSGQAP